MQLVGIIIVVKEHAVLPPAKTLLYFIADPVLLIAIKVVVPLRYLEGIINYPLPIWDDSASEHSKLQVTKCPGLDGGLPDL